MGSVILPWNTTDNNANFFLKLEIWSSENNCELNLQIVIYYITQVIQIVHYFRDWTIDCSYCRIYHFHKISPEFM